MLSLAIQTLGCKLNQLESDALAAAFVLEGFQILPWDAGADILVVNTCTVTSKAEQKARRLIRAILREHPRSCIVVTGCYAQLDGPALEALGREPASAGRLVVVNGDLKSALLDLPQLIRKEAAGMELPALLRQWKESWQKPSPETRFRFTAGDGTFHSRPFLKIQDGCDRACSYCRVPLARGRSVSLETENVLVRLQALEERGFGEAVLTGVSISQYQAAGFDLAGLLRHLVEKTRTIAIRLSSLEPDYIRSPLLELLREPRIRPHFHLAVQSGSPRILERMRRPYSPRDVEHIVGQLRAVKNDPFIACDMIAGFPGESPEDFSQSYELCRRLDFAWIHAFPYSPRPGTEAASFKERVPQREASIRVDALLALAGQGRSTYAARWIGKTVDVIPENSERPCPEYAAAVSGNYLRLMIPRTVAGDLPSPGRALRCRLFPGPSAEGENSRFDAVARPLGKPVLRHVKNEP